MTTQTTMTPDELAAFFGPDSTGWPDLGVTATRDGDQARVWHADDLIAWTEDSAEFPGRRKFYAALLPDRGDGHPMGVPFPAGFVPANPIKARDGERHRWLPQQFPPPAPLAVAHDGDYEPGGCDDCTCCTFHGCRLGPGSTCPTDELGESTCPCTGG